MSFWSVQAVQRTTALLAMLFIFTCQVDENIDAQPAVSTETAVTASGASMAAARSADEGQEENGPSLGSYLCLLACGIVVARQIRKRGTTHITLS